VAACLGGVRQVRRWRRRKSWRRRFRIWEKDGRRQPGSQPDSFYFGDASTSSVKAQKRRWWWDLNPTAPSFLQPPSTLLPKAAPKLFGTRRTHNRLQPHALKSADSAYYGVRRPEAIPAPQGTLQAPRTERKARWGVARLTRH
jgi:hypothetical protein